MASEYASWQPVPNCGRGTWSIFSSCVITLTLCVYTAVHLNIPAASETRAQKWQRIVKWVLLGILAPEMVAWTAWCQWTEARQLTREMQDMKVLLGDPERSSGESGHNLSAIAPLINSWTLKHSYFVIMGGFQFRPADVVHWPRPDRQWYYKAWYYDHLPKSVLSTSGFLALLKDGNGDKFPILTEGDIDDRSKADRLAKTLSCLQGSWILIEIVGRVASHLAITELEINTLAHVICAFAMYVFWWNKPLKIEQPIFIGSDRIEPWVLAHSGLHHRFREWIEYWSNGRDDPRSGPNDDTGVQLLSRTHVHTRDQNDADCDKCTSTQRHGLILDHDVSMSAAQVVETLERTPGNRICDFVAPVDTRYATQLRQKGGYGNPYWDMRQLRVNQSELEFLLKLQAGSPETWVSNFHLQKITRYLIRYSRMVEGDYADNLTSMAGTTLLSSFYGALHASLWRHHFPTTTEMWMWRISCLVVAGSSLMFALLVACVSVYRHGGKFQTAMKTAGDTIAETIIRCGPHQVRNVLLNCISIAPVLTIYVVVFCRLFLFVEAFISLRSQPWSAYQTPHWTQWLPHL